MPADRIERPVVAVDVVLLGLVGDELVALLPRRAEEPFADSCALPGVALQIDETLEEAAARALTSKGGLPTAALQRLHLEQLRTFGALYRDPRGRTVSVAYLALLRGEELGSEAFHSLAALPPGSLPFDHEEIVACAVERLRGKLRYTNIASALLDEPFTASELRRVYEAILGRTLDRSNFRAKLLKIGLIEPTGQRRPPTGSRGGRPAHLLRFVRSDGVEPREHDFL